MNPTPSTLIKRLSLPVIFTAVALSLENLASGSNPVDLSQTSFQEPRQQFTESAFKTKVFSRVMATFGLASIIIVGAVWSIERKQNL